MKQALKHPQPRVPNLCQNNAMATYKIKEQALLQEVGDETVILNLDSGEYFTLDNIGTRMIQLFQEQSDPKSVAAKITEEYEVAFDQAYSDLNNLLEEMAEHGLATKDET